MKMNIQPPTINTFSKLILRPKVHAHRQKAIFTY